MQAMMDQTYSLADFFSHVNNHCFTASYMLALLAVTIMRTGNKRQTYFHIFEWLSQLTRPINTLSRMQ